ncbi:MAG: NAD(P)-dependent dehydrogenase (short-subunit alcohol dehydrogenase family) [Verrucomicrobiales bacterium]|jgi:NAD(P)-dependent dehydrogenase (short-subunit alcohol dehydrogenase family)
MPTIHELFDLRGRSALITGGSGWLGGEFAATLAEAGASVVVTSRDRDRAAAAVAELPVGEGATHHGIALDHKSDDSIRAGFAEAVEKTGGIDILVNNGQSGTASDLTTIDAEGFADHFANPTGYFLLSRQMRDHAVERGKPASVVLIGSMYGVVGSYPDTYEGLVPSSSVAYHAQKGAVVHMTRHLAVYWAKDNVRVNCLSPGPFPGPAANAEMVERLNAKSPMKRMGQPHELKGALALLASDAGSYMTGQNLVVDGGWSAW